MAAAAQQIVDDWEQDEEGLNEELGTGGVCDQVSEAIAAVISENVPEAEFTDGGHEGDDHAYLVVYDDSEAYAVNIPPGVYETGGGYVWRKKDVTIRINDIIIWQVDRDLIADW